MTMTAVPQQRAPERRVLLRLECGARARAVEGFLVGELTVLLRLPPAHRVDTGRPLHALGVGSILGLHLKRLLELSFGVELGDGVAVPHEETVAGLAARVARALEEPRRTAP